MSKSTATQILRIGVLALGLFTAEASFAWWHGGWHRGYYGGHYGGYHWGGYRPVVWGPSYLIGTPYRNYYNYYVPRCERLRICNRFGQCWFRRAC